MPKPQSSGLEVEANGPLKTNILTLNALMSTNEVSMFKLAIKVCFENHFGLIHAMFLLLGSTKSGYFFWDTQDMSVLQRISLTHFKFEVRCFSWLN